MKREIYGPDHQDFRAMVRAFVAKEVTPHLASWEAAGQVDRSLYRAAGAAGLLGLGVEEEYGGSGVDDFRYHAVLNEELCRAGATSVVMNLNGFTDLVAPYFRGLANHEQKARWLPGLADGSLVAAVAMTEPGTGSDLRAIRTRAERTADGYLLNGTKTFISNGVLAGLVIVVARTTADDGQEELSLLVVERGMPGFERGRKLDKLGLSAQDTAELAFTDVLVPVANLASTTAPTPEETAPVSHQPTAAEGIESRGGAAHSSALGASPGVRDAVHQLPPGCRRARASGFPATARQHGRAGRPMAMLSARRC